MDKGMCYNCYWRSVRRPVNILKKTALLGVCLAAVTCTSLFADTGEAGPPMLKMVYGSRALSMGGAYVSLSDDIFYIDENPAGGDHRSVLRVSALHQEWVADTNYESIRIGTGFGNSFYLGLGFTYLYLPFTHYDLYGSSGASDTVSQSLGILNAGYHLRRLNMTIGANAKLYYYHVPESLAADQSYMLMAFDAGLLKRTNLLKSYVGPEPSLSFGLAVRNIGVSDEVDNLPMEVHGGISYRPMRPLLISSQVAVPLYEPIYGGVGVEYDFARTVYINAGVQIKENPMLGVGFGYRQKDLRVNVSYTPSLAFYNMMSITVSYAFGEYRRQMEMEKVEQLLQQAFEYFNLEMYEQSLKVLDEVLDLDPHNRRAHNLREIVLTQLDLSEKPGQKENGQ
jgi:hypothetical protein